MADTALPAFLVAVPSRDQPRYGDKLAGKLGLIQGQEVSIATNTLYAWDRRRRTVVHDAERMLENSMRAVVLVCAASALLTGCISFGGGDKTLELPAGYSHIVLTQQTPASVAACIGTITGAQAVPTENGGFSIKTAVTSYAVETIVDHNYSQTRVLTAGPDDDVLQLRVIRCAAGIPLNVTE